MTEQSVEIIRAAIDALNGGDMDGALKDAAPDFVFDQSRARGPNRGFYSRDQMQGMWAEFYEAWEEIQIEPTEFTDAGEQVVVAFTSSLRGRDGIEVQARGAWVWTIRDGLVTRLCLYQERKDALEAAGLSV